METKRAKVIMLPTDKKTNICLVGNKLRYVGDNHERFLGNWQHLYFTTDDEIKKGDWLYWTNNTRVEQLTDRMLVTKYNAQMKEGWCYKIIATTDKSLGIALIRKSFIEKYCKVEGIDEVLVELEDNCSIIDGTICSEHLCDYKLKIDSHNTITIHPIKNSWTRNEHSQNIIYAISEFAAQRGLTPTSKQMKEINNWSKNWIKKNL